MKTDVVVVGAGVSGLSFAWKATQSGRSVTVLERGDRIGGCFHSHRRPDGYWFEMGAHTCYNSYGGFLDMAVATGVAGKLRERGPARSRFGLLRGNEYRWLSPPKILLQMNWLEAAVRAPIGLFRSKAGQTVQSFYAGVVGPGNYRKLFSPFFAAVPSQSADGFPVEGPGSLFKTRPRRKEFVRSFGFEGGIQTVLDGAASAPGVTVEKNAAVRAVRKRGAGLSVELDDGRTFEAEVVAVAAPVDQAAALLRDEFGALSLTISRVKSVVVESVGVVLPRDRCWMPEVAFVVPVDDSFHSCVTRDPFPDDSRRGFAFHFKPGVPRSDKLRRIAEVLRVEPGDLGEVVEQRLTLPSPALGHDAIVAEVDQHLAGGRLALTGNYFDGLAIEDCVGRSFAEWARVSAA